MTTTGLMLSIEIIELDPQNGLWKGGNHGEDGWGGEVTPFQHPLFAIFCPCI